MVQCLFHMGSKNQGKCLHHVNFAPFLKEAGDGKRGEDRGGQGQVGVDCCTMLPVTMVCDCGVKTWPEHPQKQGS